MNRNVTILALAGELQDFINEQLETKNILSHEQKRKIKNCFLKVDRPGLLWTIVLQTHKKIHLHLPKWYFGGSNSRKKSP